MDLQQESEKLEAEIELRKENMAARNFL